jgi:hypothetical protein
LPKAKASQPNPDVHRRFLRPARMMILRSHGVYGFGASPVPTTASGHRRCLDEAGGRCRRTPDIRQHAAHRRANLMRVDLERAAAHALKQPDATPTGNWPRGNLAPGFGGT